MRRVSILCCLTLLVACSTFAADSAGRDARMKWWREARFGMFIHWGLYAIPAGTWNGKEIRGIGEWIMDRANIPVKEYEKLAARFNPTRYDPAEWVRTAKEAGVKYIVITSKHHDGFCLFDTKTTGYDVVDAAPYGKDLLKPLARECRKQGLKFCVYYSIMDWHHPAQFRANAKRYNPTRIHPERKAEYIDYMKRQLKDLLDGCDPEVLWFDGEWPSWYTEQDGREIYAYLRALKPSIIINNRVGKGRKGMEGLSKGDRDYVGDFGTPEQQIPATGLPGVDWESCMTMNNTWGYKKNDNHFKSTETLVRNLVDIASKGGNYLLNVGPTAEGLIPAPSVERLRGMGRWMKVNGESIYATSASPLGRLPWGRCTARLRPDGATLYLHVFQWPAGGKLSIPGLHSGVRSAVLLASPEHALKTESTRGGATITLPAQAPDPICSVVKLEVETPLRIERTVFEDRFEKKLDKGWSWLREHTGWWRLSKGGLEIHVEPGLAHNVKNALLRKAPDRSRGTYAVEVTVTNNTHPTVQYEQAGITWYTGGKPVFKLVKEHIDGKLYIIPGRKPMPAKTVRLRVVVTGDGFVAQYRPEGKGEFLTAASGRLPPPKDDQVSIQCYHGPTDVEHWIRFDDFRIIEMPR